MLDDFAPSAGDTVVAFVDHKQVGRLNALEAPHQRGDVGNLHRRWRLIVTDGNDTVCDAELDESGRDLARDFVTMAEDNHAVAACHRTGDDIGEQNGFPATCRGLVANASDAVAELLADGGNAALLIWAQQLHDAPAWRRRAHGRLFNCAKKFSVTERKN